MGGDFFVPKLFNRDGSRNVWCKQCRRQVGSTSSGQAGFGSVTCAICHAANTGEELSPEVQDALTNNVRLDSGFMVPQSVVSPRLDDMPDDPLLGKEASTARTGFWMRVLKAIVFAKVDDGVKSTGDVPLSKIVAKERKRSRVFAIEDNDSAVTSAQERQRDPFERK